MSIYIVRHGNTFLPNEVSRRIGVKTNLDLVSSGVKQAHDLGSYFFQENISFESVYCSNLKRTIETVKIILSYQKTELQIIKNHLFDEIDHGVDENRSEEEVIKRIGLKSIESWDRFGVAPDGWIVNYNDRIKGWKSFFKQHNDNENVLVVTSNGSARFALLALKYKVKLNDYKLRTGSFGILKLNEFREYEVFCWNQRPGTYLTK
jgi:broad specificity phosphatase PhoE